MTLTASLRLGAFGLALTALAGCSALSSIQSASIPEQAYELSPLPAGAVRVAAGRRHLEVALPTATAALASDRIVIKPTPLEIQSLPEARWINDATELVQLLLVRSLANSGRFALVTGAGTGPTPDVVLLTDLQAFQTELVGEEVTVVVRTSMTLLDDIDGRVVASRSFSNTVAVADTETETVVAAFEAAMTAQLTEVVGWLAGAPGV